MTRALATLLTRAIDYAGVFPPAQLPLASALDNYIRYRSGTEAWILDKFVARTTQLEELSRLIVERNPGDPIRVTTIARGGADRESWEDALESDAVAMNAFEETAGDFAAIEAYEVRLPDNHGAAGWIRDLRGFSEVDVYAEMAWDESMTEALSAAAESDFVLVKARTGGDSARAYPSAIELATFIQGVVQLDVPFKLTAGLHSAMPHEDSALGVRVHGFIPVFAATACAVAHDLSVRELVSILEAELPTSFRFSEGGLRANEWELTIEQLGDTRECIVGFGSCSVEEPLETLSGAGLDRD